MNLSILNQKPDLSQKIKLVILPLAPLSMIADIPGSYYKSQNLPDQYKVCGLFENILGWHFSLNDRDKLNKVLKKKDKTNESNSGYKTLLLDFFEIYLSFTGKAIHYNDLWKKSFRRGDADVHPKGTPNIDYDILKKKKWIGEQEIQQDKFKEELKRLKKEDAENKIAIEALEAKILPGGTSSLLLFFKKYSGSYPTFYTSPTLREYVSFEDEIQLGLNIDEGLLIQLENILEECSTGYLGNSEGWVEIKIERI